MTLLKKIKAKKVNFEFNKEYKSIKEPGIKKNHFGQQIRINFSVCRPSVKVFK